MTNANIEQRSGNALPSVPSDIFFFVLFGAKSITKEFRYSQESKEKCRLQFERPSILLLNMLDIPLLMKKHWGAHSGSGPVFRKTKKEKG